MKKESGLIIMKRVVVEWVLLIFMVPFIIYAIFKMRKRKKLLSVGDFRKI